MNIVRRYRSFSSRYIDKKKSYKHKYYLIIISIRILLISVCSSTKSHPVNHFLPERVTLVGYKSQYFELTTGISCYAINTQ